MNWTVFDFVFAGALIALIVMAALGVRRVSGNPFYRAGIILTVVTAVALIWVTGAVGIIGSEDNAANLVLLGLLPLLLIGALVVKFRAKGLSQTLSIIALLQFAIAGVALFAGWGQTGPSWPWDVVIGNGVFSAAWLASAWLFSNAARASIRHAHTA